MDLKYTASRLSEKGRSGFAFGDFIGCRIEGSTVVANFEGDNSDELFNRTGRYPGMGDAPNSLLETKYTGTLRLSKREVLELAEALVSSSERAPEFQRLALAVIEELRE